MRTRANKGRAQGGASCLGGPPEYERLAAQTDHRAVHALRKNKRCHGAAVRRCRTERGARQLSAPLSWRARPLDPEFLSSHAPPAPARAHHQHQHLSACAGSSTASPHLSMAIGGNRLQLFSCQIQAVLQRKLAARRGQFVQRLQCIVQNASVTGRVYGCRRAHLQVALRIAGQLSDCECTSIIGRKQAQLRNWVLIEIVADKGLHHAQQPQSVRGRPRHMPGGGWHLQLPEDRITARWPKIRILHAARQVHHQHHEANHTAANGLGLLGNRAPPAHPGLLMQQIRAQCPSLILFDVLPRALILALPSIPCVSSVRAREI